MRLPCLVGIPLKAYPAVSGKRKSAGIRRHQRGTGSPLVVLMRLLGGTL